MQMAFCSYSDIDESVTAAALVGDDDDAVSLTVGSPVQNARW